MIWVLVWPAGSCYWSVLILMSLTELLLKARMQHISEQKLFFYIIFFYSVEIKNQYETEIWVIKLSWAPDLLCCLMLTDSGSSLNLQDTRSPGEYDAILYHLLCLLFLYRQHNPRYLLINLISFRIYIHISTSDLQHRKFVQ